MDIYCLTDNGIPFYIGMSKDGDMRIKQHWYTYCNEFDFDGFILDTVNDSSATAWESFYISLFESWGFELINLYKNKCSVFHKIPKFKPKPEYVFGVSNEKLKVLGRQYLLKIKSEKQSK